MKGQRPRRGTCTFKPRARLLKLLGSELIRDEVMAVVELVKNAHDADASRVRLEMIDVTTGEGQIRVIDDGHGMGLKTLLDSWMQPAGSTKRGDDRRFTPSGRRVLGEKGVGRFAADRLGRYLSLVSRSETEGEVVRAEFDWDRFDDSETMLSEIRTAWQVDRLKTGEQGGTEITITGLRDRWNQRMFRRLSTRLQRLLNPLNGGSGFEIGIESNELPDYSGLLRQEVLGHAPYRLAVEYDGNGSISTRFGDEPEDHLPWTAGGNLTCGPARIVLHAFDLETDSLSRIGPPPEVRAWLRQWSGVSIYRDGFRVLPYGEPDDDWLRLDQRRVNNPVEHLSTNQVVGFVEITSDDNPELRDQTNRGGLIHSRALDDLKRLVLHSLQRVEAERQVSRRARVRRDEISAADEGGSADSGYQQLEIQFEEIARQVKRPLGSRIKKLGKSVQETLDMHQRLVSRDLQEYRKMAAVGQSLQGLNLVTRAQIAELGEELKTLRRKKLNGSSRIVEKIEGLLSLIGMQQSYMAGLTPRGGRTTRTSDVRRELESFRETVRPLLRSLKADVRIDVPEGCLLNAQVPPAALQQVLLILLSNTLDWTPPQVRARLRIQVKNGDGQHLILRITDNGPGIPAGIASKIFETGFSTKEGGNGLGLSLARNVLGESGASIVSVKARGRAGAAFEISLPMQKVRAGARRIMMTGK